MLNLISVGMMKIGAIALLAQGASAHFANMGLDGVSCLLYDGIKGTEPGSMIVTDYKQWWVAGDNSAHGNISIVHNQEEYLANHNGTKIGIVCVPDDVNITSIGIPYVEMEPSDEDFYKDEDTVYEKSATEGKFQITCIIRFCKNTA